MRRQNRHAKLDKGRCRNSGCNDIVCRRRHAHAENEGCNHSAEQKKHKVSCRHIDKSRRQLQPHSRFRHDTDDHTGGRTGDEHPQSAAGAFNQTVNNIIEIHPCIRAEHGGGNGNNDPCQCRLHRGVPGSKQPDNRNQRNCQMPLFFHDLNPWRKFISRRPFQLIFLRFKMNAQKYAKKVKYRRHDSRFHDFHVRNADKFRHEKRRRAHDRRHELSAGRGCRFYCSRKVFMISQFLHHRDGKRTGSDNVCYG